MQIEHKKFLFRGFTDLYIFTIFTVSINAVEKVEIDVEQVLRSKRKCSQKQLFGEKTTESTDHTSLPSFKRKKEKRQKKKKEAESADLLEGKI